MQFSTRSKLSMFFLSATLLTLVCSLVFYRASNRNATHAAPPPYTSLSGSYTSTGSGSRLLGHHANRQLTVTVALQPSNAAQLSSMLASLYNPASPLFHRWLTQGEFTQLFAPPYSQIMQVREFFVQSGLTVGATQSPFLLQATGTTAQVEAAFHTTINDYVAANGRSFFQNSSADQVPASLAPLISGVVGLSSTVQMHSHVVTTAAAARSVGKSTPSYGAGPGGSGLTPSQAASLYGASRVYQLGNKGKGQGATLAVFELSGYTPSDITTYERRFFGSTEHVQLVEINVDGGPVTPACPSGDMCGPFGSSCPDGCDSADYAGDIEVNADIEMQIAIAPKIDRILVYNAPNDFNGTTELDEYYRIAADDLADSISSSWGLCEQDAGLSMIEAESLAFKQMAAQGQSMFAATGDTGAFDCLRGSSFTGLSVDDPSSQPFVTSVGGTSFGTFNPGSNQHPSYPTSSETVWNVQNQCTSSDLGACVTDGAGGGGVSRVWARPLYQYGQGVVSSLSQKSPYCSQATSGQSCREAPDVSANADEYTPYAEFCTGDLTTNSTCATFSGGQVPAGWFGIGGTSLSSPLWSAVIALWDSVHAARFGNANVGLYTLFRSTSSYSSYFHDIVGKNQTKNTNGFYPTAQKYDMATGIGTPRISAIDISKP